MSGSRRLSQAIAEGDGISILVQVGDPDSARAAEQQGADGLVGRPLAGEVGTSTELPLLYYAAEHASPPEGADAVVLAVDEDDDERLAEHVGGLAGEGLECVLRVRVDEDVERVMEILDPELFLLSADRAGDDQHPLDRLLELLPEIPAGKLAIAELPEAGTDDVIELERAGFDAVIVQSADVRPLVGDEPPDV